MSNENSEENVQAEEKEVGVKGFLKAKNSVIGILIIFLFSVFIAWVLVQHSSITKLLIVSQMDSVVLVHSVNTNKDPRTFAVVGEAPNYVSYETKMETFSYDKLKISFKYPNSYAETDDRADHRTAVFTGQSNNDLIAIVRHDVSDLTSINEFIDSHKQQQLSGCVDLIDCIDSENTEKVIVGNFPAIIQSPREYVVYIRGEGAIFEIMTTESIERLEQILDSIRFVQE